MTTYDDCSACIAPASFGALGILFLIPAAVFAWGAAYLVWSLIRGWSNSGSGMDGGAE